jgi:His/Glu/Gln/Arg/opine family amino acid ABC transporter permease subunit
VSLTQALDHEPTKESAADLRVVKARHPWRWIATAVVLVLLAMAVNALITNPAWDWPVVGEYLFHPSVLTAVLFTLQLTALGIVLGFLLGTVIALMRLSRVPLLTSVAWGYVWLFRSVPLILQLLFWYNLAALYKQISFGIPFGPAFFSVGSMDLIGPVTAAALGLALHQACSRWTRASLRPPPRSASPAPGRSSASSSRRRCGRSCRTPETRSSAWSRAPRSSTSWPCPSSSTRCR